MIFKIGIDDLADPVEDEFFDAEIFVVCATRAKHGIYLLYKCNSKTEFRAMSGPEMVYFT